VAPGAKDDQPGLDDNLRDDRDRVKLRATNGVEGVAQLVGVGGGDEQRGAGHYQAAKACADAQRDGQHHRGRGAKHELQHQERAEVGAELLLVSRRLACVERVEAQVCNDRHEREVSDQRRIAPVAGIAEGIRENYDRDQGHDAGNNPCTEDDERVAYGARAELRCGAFRRVAHGDNPRSLVAGH
jgi:hypothetical protein